MFESSLLLLKHDNVIQYLFLTLYLHLKWTVCKTWIVARRSDEVDASQRKQKSKKKLVFCDWSNFYKRYCDFVLIRLFSLSKFTFIRQFYQHLKLSLL